MQRPGARPVFPPLHPRRPGTASAGRWSVEQTTPRSSSLPLLFSSAQRGDPFPVFALLSAAYAPLLGVTPAFPKKTKCIPICMPGSSFMHIVTYKLIQKQYHVRKKRDYQRFTLNPRNEGSKHHRKSTGGCVRLAPATSSQDFRVASSF
jgi:hypothetical protein